LQAVKKRRRYVDYLILSPTCQDGAETGGDARGVSENACCLWGQRDTGKTLFNFGPTGQGCRMAQALSGKKPGMRTREAVQPFEGEGRRITRTRGFSGDFIGGMGEPSREWKGPELRPKSDVNQRKKRFDRKGRPSDRLILRMRR